MATANAATFDGSADYLTRDTDWTGHADSKLWTGCIWFKHGVTGGTHYFAQATGSFYRINFRNGNDIEIHAENTSGTEILKVQTSVLTDTSNWHSLLWSFDLSDTGKRHLYLDDVSDLSVSVYTDAAINFTTSNHAVGGQVSASGKWNGCLGPFWMDFGQYVDFSIEANRRTFVASGNFVPVDLSDSTDGDVGGLGQPILFLNSAFASYQSNLGTGGGLTERGALTDCTGPEIAGPVGNGALAAAVSTVTSFGWRDETGIVGSLASAVATLAGEGGTVWEGSGDLAVDESVVGGGMGVGFSGDVVDWDGTGDDVLWDASADKMLWSPIPGTIPAQGISFSPGSNGLDSTASVVAGSGAIIDVGSESGAAILVAQSVTLAGSGISSSPGDGALASTDVTLSGHGPPFVYLGDGTLASQDAAVFGQATAAGEDSIVGNVAGESRVTRDKRRPRARKRRFRN